MSDDNKNVTPFTHVLIRARRRGLTEQYPSQKAIREGWPAQRSATAPDTAEVPLQLSPTLQALSTAQAGESRPSAGGDHSECHEIKASAAPLPVLRRWRV